MPIGCNKMSESIISYIVINVKRGTEHTVAEKIRAMKSVTEAIVTYGIWDIVARIEGKNLNHLNKIVTDIRLIPEIEKTSTLIGS